MKLVKVLGIIVLVLAMLAGAAWQIWGKNFAALAQMGSAVGAKHVCSCLHIAEQSMDYCLSDFVDAESMSSLEITNEGTIVTAKAPMGLGISKAKYEPGLGCSFIEP